MLKLYGFGRVNALARGHTRDLRVLWALEEMQLPFEIVGLDHPAKELSTPDYRGKSPFEQIPAIDDDGTVVSESAAILFYLARKSGRLMPRDVAGETQVVRWCFAAMNTVEPPLQSLLVLDWTSPGECEKHRAFLTNWVNRVLGNLERWFEGREFVATGEFTIADILLVHVLANMKDASLLEPHRQLVAYRDRCLARPAWKRVYDAYCARVQAA